jgi:hypothetical protein
MKNVRGRVRVFRGAGSPPELNVTIALEAPPVVRVAASTFAAELRLLDELENRDDLIGEIADVLALTLELLRERAKMANPGDVG